MDTQSVHELPTQWPHKPLLSSYTNCTVSILPAETSVPQHWFHQHFSLWLICVGKFLRANLLLFFIFWNTSLFPLKTFSTYSPALTDFTRSTSMSVYIGRRKWIISLCWLHSSAQDIYTKLYIVSMLSDLGMERGGNRGAGAHGEK